MQRNIIATIKFSMNKTSFLVIEKLANNIVKLYDRVSHQEHEIFIKQSLLNIEKIIGGKLSRVSIIIEPNYNVNAKIFLVENQVSLSQQIVTKHDVNNLIFLTKQKYTSSECKIILVQPVLFKVHDLITKNYNQAPIHKRGDSLKAMFAITTIATHVYNFIMQVVKKFHLEINQIMLEPQSLAQGYISPRALDSGSILVYVGEHKTLLAINKNFVTISFKKFDGLGMNYLVNQVIKIFNISEEKARSLLTLHGSLKSHSESKIIHTCINAHGQKKYLREDLNTIIRKFINLIKSCIDETLNLEHLGTLPLVFAGKINKFLGLRSYLVQKLSLERASLHNPLSFIELEEKNFDAIGILHFIEQSDKIMGKQFNTIVETNPNLIQHLKLNKQQLQIGIFKKIFDKIKIGVKHD